MTAGEEEEVNSGWALGGWLAVRRGVAGRGRAMVNDESDTRKKKRKRKDSGTEGSERGKKEEEGKGGNSEALWEMHPDRRDPGSRQTQLGNLE